MNAPEFPVCDPTIGLSLIRFLSPEEAKKLNSGYRDHECCEKKYPGQVAFFYQLISDAMDRCEDQRRICPSLQRFPATCSQGPERKIVGDS